MVSLLKNKWRLLFIVVVGALLAFSLEQAQGQNYIPSFNNSIHYFTGIIMTFIVWEGNMIIDTLMNKWFPWTGSAVKRIFAQFPFSLVYSSIATYILMQLYHILLTHELPLKDDPVTLTAVLMAILATVVLLSIELGIQFFQNWKVTLVEVQHHRELSLQAQLESLRTQVNPHFLFNNLSVLSSLVYDNQEKAVDFIQHLGKVYHYLLEVRSTELVDVESELQFIYAYNYLLQIRFDKAIIIEVKKHPDCCKRTLPPLALQMVIENCTKHNVATVSEPLKIQITCMPESITVENNIQLKSAPSSNSGTGLENIKSRYKYLSNKNITVKSDQNWFVVELPLLPAI